MSRGSRPLARHGLLPVMWSSATAVRWWPSRLRLKLPTDPTEPPGRDVGPHRSGELLRRLDLVASWNVDSVDGTYLPP